MTFPYSRVTERRSHIAIVASGPSLRGVDLTFPRSVTVIAVNDAIHHIPRSDFWFTSDFAERQQQNMANPRPGVTYYAAIWMPYLEWYGLKSRMGHVRFLERVDGRDFPVGYEKARPGLPGDPGKIHAGNSAWGAFQLAVHMQARSVALFGVDGKRNAGYAWGEGRPKGSLTHLPHLFASAAPELQRSGVEVVNGSPESTVACFPRCEPEEAKAWLVERARKAA